MRHAATAVVAALAIAGAGWAQTGAQVSSTTLTLQRVSFELPSLGVANVVLHTGGVLAGAKGPFALQKLHVGNVEIPLLKPADVVPSQDETAIRFEVQLRTVPEMILAVPIDQYVPIAWEGYTEGGLNKLAIEGRVNPWDNNSVEVPRRALYENYTKIADVRMSTDGGKVLVRVLASLYNPLAFDLIANSLEYSVKAGEREIVAGKQRGFRVRGQRWSDVVIEQEISPADAAAGGLEALLKPSSVEVNGLLSIRTPTGDRLLKLQLGGH